MTCLQPRFSVSTDTSPALNAQSQLCCQVAPSTLHEHIPMFKAMFLFRKDVSDTLTAASAHTEDSLTNTAGNSVSEHINIGGLI